jgi:competence ComEA-like helix-hairpin-helix protein
MTTRLIKVALAGFIWATFGAIAWAQLPDGPGRDVTVQLCGNCHDVEVVRQYHQEKSAWTDTISQMVEKGLVATDDQLNTILEYLVKNFGPPVNVNKATASELEKKLEITTNEAAAIVKYRGEKGPFKEIDDLKKVPDLDFKKIEAKKDRLVF